MTSGPYHAFHWRCWWLTNLLHVLLPSISSVARDSESSDFASRLLDLSPSPQSPWVVPSRTAPSFQPTCDVSSNLLSVGAHQYRCLLNKQSKFVSIWIELTANIDGLLECSCNLRIEIYNQIAILCYLVVAFLYSLTHKLFDRLADNSVDDIHDEISW